MKKFDAWHQKSCSFTQTYENQPCFESFLFSWKNIKRNIESSFVYSILRHSAIDLELKTYIDAAKFKISYLKYFSNVQCSFMCLWKLSSVFIRFQPNLKFHIETIHIIVTVNQVTVFCVKSNTDLKLAKFLRHCFFKI